jgi:carboxymethylenebutenolidase
VTAPSVSLMTWASGTPPSARTQPVAPIQHTQNLSCPLLGLFGNEDRAPTPEQVDQHEAELKKYRKDYEFHHYEGAGRGFFYYDRPMYRIEQALDGWQKVFAFSGKHLAK